MARDGTLHNVLYQKEMEVGENNQRFFTEAVWQPQPDINSESSITVAEDEVTE